MKLWIAPMSHLWDTESPMFDSDVQVYKWLKGALNRITPEGFMRIVRKMRFIPGFTSTSTKESIVDLIIEKASSEEMYSRLYTELFVCLNCVDKRNCQSENILELDFFQIMVRKCQLLFNFYFLALAEPQTPDGEEVYRKMRIKAVGFMKFASELYNKGVLMDGCMTEMLECLYLENVECAAKILATAGPHIEKAIFLPDSFHLKEIWNKSWGWMWRLAFDPECYPENRLRFMAQDLNELAINNWQPRPVMADSAPMHFKQLYDKQCKMTLQEAVAEESRRMMLANLEETLFHVLKAPHFSRSVIPQWIESHLQGVNVEDLVYALVRAIIRDRWESDCAIDGDSILLLKQYTCHNRDLEAVLIEAVRDLMAPYNEEIDRNLSVVLDRLYSERVVVDQSVVRWSKRYPSDGAFDIALWLANTDPHPVAA